jgi:cellulose synthase/poly-beta-1,6-N-acetylglucosamine synthase-like glycosyltransferase/peptidoglycan/xylan/chitin deacetylase (PgdA/CDA1 family)
LKEKNVPATFFFTGANIFKHKDIVRNIHKEGFEIGNHTFTHSPNIHKSKKRLVWELDSTNKLFHSITGEDMRYYRPPFLLHIGPDPTLNTTFAEEPLAWSVSAGYIPIGADIDPKDFKTSSVKEFGESLKEATQRERTLIYFSEPLPYNGHIILLHDHTFTSPEYIDMLSDFIDTMRTDGYRFVSLETLLSSKQQTILSHDMTIGATDATTNGEVSLLQAFLKDYGGFPYLTIDGYYSRETYNALILWQDRKGLLTVSSTSPSEIGVVGAKTREKISLVSKPYGIDKILPAEPSPPNINSIQNDMEDIYVSVISFVGNRMNILIAITITLIALRMILLFILLYIPRFKNQSKHILHASAPYMRASVLVPAHNEEKNIEATLLSLIENTHRPHEIIVIDDGSTDNTAHIVKRVQLQHPSQTLIIKTIKNTGKANALNIGITLASNDIIVAIDADTIFTPNTIGNLVRHFSDEHVSAVAGRVYNARNDSILSILQSIEYIVGQNLEKQAFGNINAISVVPGAIGAWRKSAIISAGGYDADTLVEDQDLTLKVLRAGGKIMYDKDAIAYTEAPHTLRSFLKQRFRWVFGTMQCLWKHKQELFNTKRIGLGWIALPNIMIFGTFLQLFYPIIGILTIVQIAFGSWEAIIVSYAAFTLIDFLYAGMAFWHEKENRHLILMLPLQRLYYQQIMFYVIIKSVLYAFTGTRTYWNNWNAPDMRNSTT